MTLRPSQSPPASAGPPRAASRPDDPRRSDPSLSESAGSGTGFSGAEFVGDPGPAFDPKRAPEAPEPLQDELEGLAEQWSEEQVRGMLTMQGGLTHAVLRVGEEDTDTWKHTEDDLQAIAPPLTRILNRYDMTRAAAAAGDEILLGTAVFSYAAKNYTRRRVLLARRDQAEPRPVTGAPAPEGTGPEHDPEWQRTHDPAFTQPPVLIPKGNRR